ncbi:hypothetical protein NQZ68_015165 [Dissostichus eleginoides]|nr:hypothetical protein NQZ68_015165 [Dissostichus eleginoides]
MSKGVEKWSGVEEVYGGGVPSVTQWLGLLMGKGEPRVLTSRLEAARGGAAVIQMESRMRSRESRMKFKRGDLEHSCSILLSRLHTSRRTGPVDRPVDRPVAAERGNGKKKRKRTEGEGNERLLEPKARGEMSLRRGR